MLVLADPIFSREQCSLGSLRMRWHAAPPVELRQEFGGLTLLQSTHTKTLFGSRVGLIG